MATIIRYKGAEPVTTPGGLSWQPKEKRTIDDKDEAALFIAHPDFEEVKKKDDATEEQQDPAPSEQAPPSDEPPREQTPEGAP